MIPGAELVAGKFIAFKQRVGDVAGRACIHMHAVIGENLARHVAHLEQIVAVILGHLVIDARAKALAIVLDEGREAGEIHGAIAGWAAMAAATLRPAGRGV